jgi:hypothetical protein
MPIQAEAPIARNPMSKATEVVSSGLRWVALPSERRRRRINRDWELDRQRLTVDFAGMKEVRWTDIGEERFFGVAEGNEPGLRTVYQLEKTRKGFYLIEYTRERVGGQIEESIETAGFNSLGRRSSDREIQRDLKVLFERISREVNLRDRRVVPLIR